MISDFFYTHNYFIITDFKSYFSIGSPLNIRQSPNGKIVGKLRNGTRVVVHDYDYDRKGRPWAYVTSNRGAGWVFREFIACY